MATFRQAADAYRSSVELNVHLKTSSVDYRKQTIEGLLSSWLGLAERRLADIPAIRPSTGTRTFRRRFLLC
jgi:hypothetical protein